MVTQVWEDAEQQLLGSGQKVHVDLPDYATDRLRIDAREGVKLSTHMAERLDRQRALLWSEENAAQIGHDVLCVQASSIVPNRSGWNDCPVR